MKRKSKSANPEKQAQLAQLIPYLLLALPVPAIILSVLAHFDVSPSQTELSATSVAMMIFLTLTWLSLSLVTIILRHNQNKQIATLLYSTYFLTSAVHTWLISGLASLFAAYWSLLLIASFLLLDKIGYQISVLAFLVVSIVSAVLVGHNDSLGLLSDTMIIIAVLISSFIVVIIHLYQQTMRHDLLLSQRREEIERGRTLTLINNITDAVLGTDQDGNVKVHNAAALSLLDTNQDIVDMPIDQVIQLHTIDDHKINTFKELSRSRSIRQRDDIIMRLSDGDQLRLEVTFAPVQNSSESGTKIDSYVLIIRDVTRLKSLEEERDEFISVVSHELRTPVAIAEASLSNSKILSTRGLQEKTEEAIDEAHKQVLFLAKMVNDLSTLSRAERGTSDEPEIIDPIEFAKQLDKEYSSQAEEKNLEFILIVPETSPHINVSRLYLHELLQNLITNAIRYTHQGSITLKLEHLKGYLRFSVQDTGIGIGKSDQSNIFKRFYRAEDYRTRETSGTGLGLYISAKLAKKLNCKIDLTSRLNHGSTFSFKIPIHDK